MKKFIAGAAILLFASVSAAAPIEQSISVSLDKTNFSKVLNFNQFDNLGGSLLLQSVSINIDGLLNGTAQAESLDAQASSITTTLNAALSLSGSGAIGNLLEINVPTVTNFFAATANDGLNDFGGFSGVTYTGLGGAVSSFVTLTGADVLAFFTGLGSQDLSFNVNAVSNNTGPGNVLSAFEMEAGGVITVTYNSVEQQVVSAPSMAILFGLGAFAVFGFTRLKR